MGAIVLLWTVSGFLSYRDARHEINELFDAQLAESAKILLAEAAHEIGEMRSESGRDAGEEYFKHRYGQKISFQIWNQSGRLLMRSSSTVPVEPLSTIDTGYATHHLGDGHYRTFALWDRHHRLQIQVAQFTDTREKFSGDIALHILIPMLLALPLLALLILWSVNRALRPLTAVAAEVLSRDPNHLEAIPVEKCPTETRPLVDGINLLLLRLKKEFEKERRFTSDASHELRTPLAALKIQAEVAMNAVQPEERKHALEQIIFAVDRSGHLVSQLLTLARLDPDATLERREPVQLDALVSEVLRELAPTAIAKSIDLSFQGAQAVTQGNRAMLSILVRNLVDNAIRYTQKQGKVQVSTRTNEAGVFLEVQDDGPGIIQEDRERVFDRFYRVPGTTSDGSGLGLSIVKRIIDLHSGSIGLEGPPGLRVRVFLPHSTTRP